MRKISDLIPNLVVRYDDTSILEKESESMALVNNYFDKVTCHNKELKNLLYEVIGYSLLKTAKLRKAFIFKGNGSNGKSVIFRIIESLLGSDYCSHEHLENISGAKAGAKSTIKYLEGRTVNIAEDQKTVKYINTSYLTRLISGEPIVIDHKENESKNEINRESIIMESYATLLFSVNETVDLKETGRYITNRFYIIPFNSSFIAETERDINIAEKLCRIEPLQIIATRAVEAIKKVLETGKFTIPEIVEKETKKYFMECNNVIEFCEMYPIKKFISKTGYYEEYCKWCITNNVENVGNNQFGMKIKENGYRSERYSFGNKRSTYYTSPDFDNAESRTIYEEYLNKYHLEDEQEIVYSEDEKKELFGISFNEYLNKLLYEIE